MGIITWLMALLTVQLALTHPSVDKVGHTDASAFTCMIELVPRWRLQLLAGRSAGRTTLNCIVETASQDALTLF